MMHDRQNMKFSFLHIDWLTFCNLTSFVRVQTTLPIGTNLGVLFTTLIYFIIKFLIITYLIFILV